MLSVTGNVEEIATLAQILAWIASAMRASTSGVLQYATSHIDKKVRSRGLEFDIWAEQVPLSDDEMSCWLPLFPCAVIARGFPISQRHNNEVGLEIPIDLMATLGGAMHAVDYHDGLVMKGFSTMFVPIARTAKDSIQWHFLHNADGSRLPYHDVTGRCPIRASLDEVSHESLGNTRNFLGLWPVSETHLGTSDSEYQGIRWSSAKQVEGSATSISGFTLDFSKIITGQISFAVSKKDSTLYMPQKETFESIVTCAEKTPILLYDPSPHESRAWLVHALDVILHIMHKKIRQCKKRGLAEAYETFIWEARPMGSSLDARERLVTDLALYLGGVRAEDEKLYTIKDTFLEVWSYIERIMDERPGGNPPDLKIPGITQTFLQGWEYMALVEGRNFRLKEKAIMKSNGWLQLVKDINAVILFANGFGDVITPGGASRQVCQKWIRLPKEKDYMATTVPMLESLFREAGSDSAQGFLTSTGLQWHCGSVLFESCATGPGPCSCDRLQQIVRKSPTTFGTIRPLGKLEESGCVAFGQEQHSMISTFKAKTRAKRMYLHDNHPIGNTESPLHITEFTSTSPSSTPITEFNHQSPFNASELIDFMEFPDEHESEPESTYNERTSRTSLPDIHRESEEPVARRLYFDGGEPESNQRNPSELWLSLPCYRPGRLT